MRDGSHPSDNSTLPKSSDAQVENYRAIQQGYDLDVSSEKILHPGLSDLIEKDTHWANGIKVMKDFGASNAETWKVMDSFSNPPDVVITDSDMKVQRWYGGEAKKINAWVTSDKFETGEEARKYLNLPDVNKANKPPADLIIEKEATILMGPAKGDGANPGGGNQIYVLDTSKIHEA